MNGRYRRRAGSTAIALLIVALSFLTAVPGAAQTAPRLRIACSNADAFGEAIYANEAGFFKQAGLDVELVTLANSGAVGAAVAGGSVDIGLANPIAIANAQEQGLPFKIIAPSALYRADKPTSVLVVPNASPLRSPKDLEGKTVAVIEVRGIMEAGIRSWMVQAHADPSNVRFIEMSFSTMLPALTQGRVDAAFIAEPVLTSVRSSVRVLGNPYAALAREWYSNVWFAKGDWIEQNSAAAHRFVETIEKAADWANTHQTETGETLLQVTKMPRDLVTRMTRTDFADSLEVSKIQPVLDTAVHYGAIKSQVSAKDLIAPGF